MILLSYLKYLTSVIFNSLNSSGKELYLLDYLKHALNVKLETFDKIQK